MFFFKNRSRNNHARDPWNLSTPLLSLSAHDNWTIGDSVQGTLDLGATGSGKTSGSGREIALSFLRAGYGGIVLTVKNEELALWESYCREAHRLKDLLVFGPEQSLRFNFLDYELHRPGAGAGLTENIVHVLLNLQEASQRRGGQDSGRENDGYWQQTKIQLARNCTDLLIWATGHVSVPDLYQLVISAPISREQARSEEWKKSSFCYYCLNEATKRPLTEDQKEDLAHVADFFMIEFAQIAEKTRGIINSTFSSTVDVLNRGLLRKLFCTDTNVTPEIVEGGEILVLALPIMEFGQVGQMAQAIWKYAFQRHIARRDVLASPRPVFLWIDEAQHFLTSHDMMFQTTCRSYRVATVLLSQNVSNFYAALGGGEKAKAEADSLFGNLNTKLFHANGDPVTNKFAAETIGQTRQFMINASSSQNGDWMDASSIGGRQQQSSSGINESYQYDVPPHAFTTLRTGGYAHNGNVDAMIFQSGRRFRSSGRPWMPITFIQRKAASG
jgi:hypothetical protein